MSGVEWHRSGEIELALGRQMQAALDRAAFAITAAAVGFSGVDTGRLIQSMGHSVERAQDGDGLVARLGSGMGDGARPVSYWAQHWAGRDAPDQASLAPDTDRLPSRPHPTRPAPTTPYARAMRQLGVDFQIEPGGFEA